MTVPACIYCSVWAGVSSGKPTVSKRRLSDGSIRDFLTPPLSSGSGIVHVGASPVVSTSALRKFVPNRGISRRRQSFSSCQGLSGKWGKRSNRLPRSISTMSLRDFIMANNDVLNGSGRRRLSVIGTPSPPPSTTQDTSTMTEHPDIQDDSRAQDVVELPRVTPPSSPGSSGASMIIENQMPCRRVIGRSPGLSPILNGGALPSYQPHCVSQTYPSPSLKFRMEDGSLLHITGVMEKVRAIEERERILSPTTGVIFAQACNPDVNRTSRAVVVNLNHVGRLVDETTQYDHVPSNAHSPPVPSIVDTSASLHTYGDTPESPPQQYQYEDGEYCNHAGSQYKSPCRPRCSPTQ